MWHRVEVMLTDVSEERIASIFRVEGKIRKSAREASIRDVKSQKTAFFRLQIIYLEKASHLCIESHNQGPDFDMPSFFPCILCDALKYINLGYELLVTEM
jgi:hypothetical protein